MSVNIRLEYNRAKIKLIHKYLKRSKYLSRAILDPNTFVSINDFLAEEYSLGTEADKGNINYAFDSNENINLFIDYLIKHIGYDKIICRLNDVYFRWYENGNYYCIKNVINYDLDKDEMTIPLNLKKEIIRCSNSNRFICVYMYVHFKNKSFYHANILLIDILNKTIERFEPHGKFTKFDDNHIIYLKNFDNKFSKKTLEILNLTDYTYISTIKYLPNYGLQAKADALGGLCLTYCIMYFQLRIMNPDLDRKLLIKYLLSKSKDELLDMILRYTKFIENTLKHHSREVNDTLDFFYRYECMRKTDYVIINSKNEYNFEYF